MSFEDYTDDLIRLQKDWSTIKPEEAGGELPDGDYQVSVHTTTLKRSKTGNLMFSWQLRILSPTEYSKRFLFRQNMLQNRENLVWLKKDLATCGVELEDLTTLKDRMKDLLERVLLVKKETVKGFKNVYIQSLLALDSRDFVPIGSETPF